VWDATPLPDSVSVPLFKRLLGSSFDELPAPIRSVHDGRARKVLSGRCSITRGDGFFGRFLGWVVSLPRSGRDLPLRVTFLCDGAGEIWSRDFGGCLMRSALAERDGLLEEVLGPVRFRFALRTDDDGIAWHVAGISVLGVPLPAAWFTAVTARQSAAAGRYTFDIRAELPCIGLLVHYRGWLDGE
jgi:hypothetical protein